MKIKLPALLISLALIAACVCACYPVSGDDGYRTMPVGTGTEAPAVLETSPGTEAVTAGSDVTTLSPDVTDSPDTGDDTTSANPDATSAPDTTAEDTTPPVIITYEFDVISRVTDLGTASGKKCTATLRFPALTGLEDTSKQANINSLLSDIATVEFQNRLPNASELIASGTAVNYEITATSVTYMGNNLLSVRSEGVIDYASDSSDEKFVYCNLINLSTGRDISFKKVYSDFGAIMDLLSAGKFKQISGDSSLVSSTLFENIIKNYIYSSQYSTFPETYFTHDSLVIVVETDRENGYFAEFSISLDEVNGCLTQSPTK